ncbi:saccharopine dehydrogenase [Nocardia sp. BSTN01]|uniref:saccharopine dehydrogenase n=1 Tax=Nocardia sp. BSTN01 TaxID=2783665 RepID=UPI00189076C7|nr:saccharopine dehydrogenase [Nocardia sp. BSTN01]MBF4999559.1 saccharopine dehydrogenase [Nocardia sp. BSTN01]
MKVLVLGGYGAVGTHVVTELRRTGVTAVAAGRNPARADTPVDLGDPLLTGYRAALAGTDVVVNASGAENPALAAVAGAARCAFVDITATSAYIEALRRLPTAAPILVDVGLAPGLTDLLAHAVHRDAPGPIDLAVLLGAGEHHGAAATEWSYRLLGRHFHAHGQRVRNYTRPKSFRFPGHRRPRLLYRADFADQHTLSDELRVPVRTFFGLDSRTATAALAAATWLPGASRVPRGLHFPGSDRWIVLARDRHGGTRWAHGHGQSRATGVIAAAAAARAPDTSPGVHALPAVLGLADLPADEICLGRTR